MFLKGSCFGLLDKVDFLLSHGGLLVSCSGLLHAPSADTMLPTAALPDCTVAYHVTVPSQMQKSWG